MSWRFPPVKFVDINTVNKQLEHVQSEAMEVRYALYQHRIDEEMADLLHSCETYFRIRQREGSDIHQIFNQVVEKNRARGYYDD